VFIVGGLRGGGPGRAASPNKKPSHQGLGFRRCWYLILATRLPWEPETAFWTARPVFLFLQVSVLWVWVMIPNPPFENSFLCVLDFIVICFLWFDLALVGFFPDFGFCLDSRL
jgi:hypothetical protein